MDPRRGWSTGASLEADDDSYDSTLPPSYGPSKSKQQAGSRGGRTSKDVYDFDISNDDDDDGYPVRSSTGGGVRTSTRSLGGAGGGGTTSLSRDAPMRRISVEDRAKEIQKSYGSTRTVPLATDSPSPKSAGGRGKQQQVDAGDSWKRSYEDLMAGLADSPDPAQSSPLSPAGGPTSPKGLGAESVGDSSYGDSLEISAADLEVGEYAKRRASEKTADRQRRMALDVAPHTLVNKGAPPKVAASPDIANKMRNRPGESGAGAGARGFQMSAALSSIGNFSDDEDEVTGASRKGVQRYGSVEKSDADLFKKLGGTEAARAAAVAPSTMHVSSLDDASDEDEDGNDEDDDDQGSDLAHSNEFESGEGAGDDDDDDEENEAEEEQKAAPKQPDLEAIRQRWLPSTAAAAAVQEQQKEEAEVPVPAATEAPRVVVVPSPANADEEEEEDEDEDDDKEDEAEMDAIQPGAKLLTAVGSASMVTSVPPPPPPVMSESAELTLTTTAPAISMWASATSLSADSNNVHDESRASTSTPPAPSYAASLAVPSLPPVQATEGAAAAALGMRGSLRYAVEHEDQDQSLVEQASFSYPAPVEADPDPPAPPAPPAPAAPAVSAPAPARAVSVADIVPTPDTVPVSYFKPAEAGLGSSGAHFSASGNAGHFSGLPRQAPVGPSLSGGQAAVNKIVAFEVDPFALGLGGVSSSLRGSSGQGLGSVGASLAVRSVQSRSSLSPSRPPPPPATGWPKELPLVAPSAEDLHAHIAVMESTNKRRIAAATAQKIKNFKNKSADSASALGVESTRQTGKTLPKRSRSAAASSHAAGTTAPAVPAAVNRLEQGTARLARQYEELQQELQNLRQDRSGRESKAVQASSTLPSRSLVSGPSPTRIPAPSKAAATSSSSSSSSSRVGRGAKGSQPAVAASVGTGDDATLDQSSGVWQSVALQTMKKIVAEGDRLGEREKELAVREEALRLRQSVGETGVYAALGDAALSAHRGLSASAAAAASVPPHRVKDEEFLALQQSEALAVAEVARLKAELFELQNADVGVSPNDTSIQIRASKPKRQHYKAGGAPAPVEEGVETVTISKAEHDKLLHDLAEQEVLITGFQKENERLMQALKQREAEETSRKAHFYDKQESLNKELLRLRNAETGAPAVRRSAEALRQELDADATIRALKERLAMAEAGAGQREKDLQMTIDKLRKENRELAATSARVPSKVFSGADEDHDALAADVKRLEGEVTTLRGKLAWYAENQSLLAGLEKDKVEAQAAASALKRELRKKGVDGRTIEGIVRQAQAGSDSSSPTEEGGADSSMFSSATKGASARAHGSGRSQADIRKIKELEEAVSELQECLRKRHPDSITSLVRAASMSDSVQAERQRESEAVETMRRELVEAKTAYELKLRSIRQEHERLEVGYKQRILSLEGLAAASSASTPTPTKASPSGATKGAPVRTLPQAQARIKELEEECERIRTFYTRKVDEAQKKAEAQLRALKRTGSSPSSPAEGSDAVAADVIDAADGGGVINSAAAAVREEYEQRLKMLEEELVRTATELGAARRELSNQQQTHSSSAAAQAFAGAPSFVSIDSVRAHPAFESEVAKEAELRTMRLRLADLEARAQAPAAAAAAAAPASAAVGAAPQAASTEEVERLQRRLRLEEERCRDLQSEVSSLRARANESASNGPSLAVLQNMEAQLSALESRLQRRERELTAAVEEGRNASKIERARLEALHAAELRERDEQLVKFQQELETLVYALRQWQHAAAAGGEASSSPSFHPMPATNLPVFV